MLPAPTSAPTAPAPRLRRQPGAHGGAVRSDSCGSDSLGSCTGSPLTGFPASGNTGVPAGTQLRASSSLVLSTPNAVVDGLDVTGSVQINASGVTLRRSRVTSGRDFSVIRVKEGVTGVRIEDVTINGLRRDVELHGRHGPGLGPRSDIRGVENGVTPVSGSVVRTTGSTT